jgi:hypothetical protein
MRYGYPLTYFKTGESSYYVFAHCDGFVEDYKTKYEDDKSLIELIGNFIERETGDEKYALKMVKVLAKKFGVEKDLREKPMTNNEFFRKVMSVSKHDRSSLISKKNSK